MENLEPKSEATRGDHHHGNCPTGTQAHKALGAIILFICNWAPYRCWMDSSITAAGMPISIYPIKVPCAGRVDPAMILAAFEQGAAGVLVAGCRGTTCRFGLGHPTSEKNGALALELIETLGLEPERFQSLYFESHEADRFLSELKAFSETVDGLDPSPWMAS